MKAVTKFNTLIQVLSNPTIEILGYRLPLIPAGMLKPTKSIVPW